MKRLISLSLLLTMLFGAMFGIMPAAEDGELVIKSAQVEFGTTVFLNIAVDFSGIADADTSKIALEVTSKNGSKVTLAPDATVENVPEGCVAFKYTKLSAKNMGDKVKLQAYYDGVASGASVDYSILQYSIVAKYENPENAEFCELVDAMLAFGAAAQQVFLIDGEDVEEKYDYDLSYEDGYCYIKMDESVNVTTCDLDGLDAVSEEELALLRNGTVWPIGYEIVVELPSTELVYDQNMVWRIKATGSLFDELKQFGGYIREGEAVTLYQLPNLQHLARYSSDRWPGGLNLNPRPVDGGEPDVTIASQEFSTQDIYYIEESIKEGNEYGNKFTLSFSVASLSKGYDSIYLIGESYFDNNTDGTWGTNCYVSNFFNGGAAGGRLPLFSNCYYDPDVAEGEDPLKLTSFIRPTYSTDFKLVYGCAFGTKEENLQPLSGSKTSFGAYTLLHIVFDCTDPDNMVLTYYVNDNMDPVYTINSNLPSAFFTEARNSDSKKKVWCSWEYGSPCRLGVMSAHITKGDVRYASEWAAYYD